MSFPTEKDGLMRPLMEEGSVGQKHLDDRDCGFACEWGSAHGGHLLFDCCECSPCCGDPCSPIEGLYCCCLFTWCPCCTASKLWAYSMDQECAVINHFLPICCCGYCVAPCLRANLRNMHNIGDPGCVCGDACVSWTPINLCGYCQEIRSVPKEGWDFLGAGNIQLCSEPFTFLRPPVVIVQ